MTYAIISNGELYHYGVKGMHWGVRRYQNKDGTRTALGKKRSSGTGGNNQKANSSSSARDKLFTRSIKVSKDKAPISPAEKITKDVANISTNVENISRRSRKRQPKENLEELSNEELAMRIRRLELEKRYSDLSQKDIDDGKMTVADYASVLASVAMIAGSAASIYSLLKDL